MLALVWSASNPERWALRAQVSDHGLDAAVIVGVLVMPSFAHAVGDVAFDRAFCEDEAPSDAGVREPLGHQTEDLRSRSVSRASALE